MDGRLLYTRKSIRVVFLCNGYSFRTKTQGYLLNKMIETDQLIEKFCELANIEVSARPRRQVCDKCWRPVSVCWCPYLPHEPVDVKTTIWILQHPSEKRRRIHTARILLHSLKPGKCKIFRGTRFSKSRHPEVWDILNDTSTVLLYPGTDATPLSDLPCIEGVSTSYNLVILDGTWVQAKGMYAKNPALWKLRKVEINIKRTSKYVVRTQPTNSSLSTLETGAVALAVLEQRPDLEEVLTRPLVALCEFQMQHGAVRHDSKEYQIENGTYEKKLRKSIQNRLARQAAQQSQS